MKLWHLLLAFVGLAFVAMRRKAAAAGGEPSSVAGGGTSQPVAGGGSGPAVQVDTSTGGGPDGGAGGGYVPLDVGPGGGIVVITDEAHRSQYEFIEGFARNLRDGLPNASFIGFTGTPIELDDKSTPAVFGESWVARSSRTVEIGARRA